MSLFAPDYYTQFYCIADRCRHSCCIGWEIDIDEDTLEYYGTIDGEIGERLKKDIICKDGTACFALGENERCCFLNQNGLCDIITELGEQALCQICDDHPRYRNFYSDRTEIGVGLCCEAAAKLIVSAQNKTQMVCIEDYGEEMLYQDEAEFLQLRQRIFDIAQDRNCTVENRLQQLICKYSISMPQKTAAQWAEIYRKLEKLDDARDVLLSQLENAEQTQLVLPQTTEYQTAFEQLLVYFIYRHLTDSLDDGLFGERMAFAVLSCQMIMWFCGVHYHTNGKLTIEDIAEIARVYSSEVEYSQDNMDALFEIVAQ
ncbi:MAG: flagellin lysine-N-methylase [Oscillospiraceae bacterium]|nr:flagellin lysine-N-methylase [Oscillospiraceae bacterium]